MPMISIEGEYELIITHKCNWNCPYCSELTHDKQEISYSDVMEKISTIPDGSVVTLSGGEPGMLSFNDINGIILSLKDKNCQLNLNTNGLFIARYPEMLSGFNYILYHCSEDLKKGVKIYDYVNVHHCLVLTDNNVGRFGFFVDKYPHIKWNVIPSSIGKYTIPTLNRTNKMNILKKYGSHLTDESKQRLIKDKDWSKIKFI